MKKEASITSIEKGEVRLRVDCNYIDDSQCEFKFSVIDTGIGIKEEARQSLFQPFTQADSSVTRRYVSEISIFDVISCREEVDLD